MSFFCIAVIGCAGVSAAVISDVSGTAETAGPAGGWRKARIQMTLGEKDRVRCGAGARAVITLDDGHRVKLWPKTEVALSKLKCGQSKIDLMAGRIRAWVRKLGNGARFEVKTPVAVCSVRGTEFSVAIENGNDVRVEVFEGQVAAREESSGQQVLVNPGQFTEIMEGFAPSAPVPMESETSSQADDTVSADVARQEARQEIFQEITREAVIARAADEIRLAEYENGKTAIDATGSRVRMEEYIVRSHPNEFKYVVLNERQDRFDFGKIIFTFNDTLPDDLALATRTMFQSNGSTAPRWYLTDMLSVMSNTVDQVNEEATGGQMYPDNPVFPHSWTLGFSEYTFSVNTTPWWRYADANHNGIRDAGEITYYNIATGQPIRFANDFQYDDALQKYYFENNGERTYFTEFTAPDGPDAFHFLKQNNYSTTQWIAAEDLTIDDSGKVVTVKVLSGTTADDIRDAMYRSNFERIYTASVFQGRKIDLVYSAKLLVDAGILPLPDLHR
jgi:hypothetical protein